MKTLRTTMYSHPPYCSAKGRGALRKDSIDSRRSSSARIRRSNGKYSKWLSLVETKTDVYERSYQIYYKNSRSTSKTRSYTHWKAVKSLCEPWHYRIQSNDRRSTDSYRISDLRKSGKVIVVDSNTNIDTKTRIETSKTRFVGGRKQNPGFVPKLARHYSGASKFCSSNIWKNR